MAHLAAFFDTGFFNSTVATQTFARRSLDLPLSADCLPNGQLPSVFSESAGAESLLAGIVYTCTHLLINKLYPDQAGHGATC